MIEFKKVIKGFDELLLVEFSVFINSCNRKPTLQRAAGFISTLAFAFLIKFYRNRRKGNDGAISCIVFTEDLCTFCWHFWRRILLNSFRIPVELVKHPDIVQNSAATLLSFYEILDRFAIFTCIEKWWWAVNKVHVVHAIIQSINKGWNMTNRFIHCVSDCDLRNKLLILNFISR